MIVACAFERAAKIRDYLEEGNSFVILIIAKFFLSLCMGPHIFKMQGATRNRAGQDCAGSRFLCLVSPTNITILYGPQQLPRR